MPGVAAKARPVEHVHAGVEPSHDLGDAHRPGAGGGDLDGERQTVDAAAQLHHRRQVGRADDGARVPAALEEQLHRRARLGVTLG